MAVGDVWETLVGTTLSYFRVGGGLGFRLKNLSGNVGLRNAGDSADVELTASKVNVSGNDIVLNSDADGSSADWTYTLRVPSSGMTAAVLLVLPTTDGSPGQFIQTDGNGVLTFADGGDTAPAVKMEQTDLAFGDSSPVTMFTLPANNVIPEIWVHVDTAFNGSAPTMSVGYSGGSASAYLPATSVDLKTTGTYKTSLQVAADASPRDLQITFAGDSSSAGAARVVVFYGEPS